MKVEVPIPNCYISANLYLHKKCDTDLHQLRVWRAAFLKGIHEFKFTKCFMGLIFVQTIAPCCSTPQGKDLPRPT